MGVIILNTLVSYILGAFLQTDYPQLPSLEARLFYRNIVADSEENRQVYSSEILSTTATLRSKLD